MTMLGHHAMAPSIIDLSTIAARAASIYERAATITERDAAAATPDPAAAEAIHAWSRAFSPGDPAAFLRRLTWDGLDLETVLAAASVAETVATDRSWTIWLERASEQARALALDIPSGQFAADPGLQVPFEEIWTAFRRTTALNVDLPPGWQRSIAPDAIAAFERQLCVELSRQGELALFELYRSSDEFRPIAEELRPDTRYRRFVIRLLDEGLVPLFNEYPVLARALASLTSDWVDATTEFLVRLCGDRQHIASTFGGDPGAAVAIETGLSDPHHGRRRVAAVRFRSGLQLVYKPREVALERCFHEFLRWINPHLEVPLKALTVLDRGAYGWIEFADHSTMPDAAAAAGSFRQSGSLLCIAHLLGAQDLHMENLIVTAEGPVLVDAEMLLQSIPRQERSSDADPDPDSKSTGSALETGMLSLVTVTGAGAVYDSGGMRGQISGPLPFPHRVWRDLRSDSIHFQEEPSFRSVGRHQTRIGDTVLDPADYAPMLLEGFADAYRCLLRHRDELMSASGPLHACAGGLARVTLRPTNQYAMLSFVLAGPRYQRSGVARSTAVEVLNRLFAGYETRPPWWAAVIEERRAIARLDVPYFSVRGDGADLLSEGRVVVADCFVRSGLEAALARVHRLSERDLNTQVGHLRRALGESCASRYSPPVPAAESRQDRAIEFAVWIASELVRRADREDDALIWPGYSASEPGLETHGLYQGSLGPALLFAALAATTRDARWRDHAQATLVRLRRAIASDSPVGGKEPNIGGAAGLGSVVYGLTVAGSLLSDATILDAAETAAAALAGHVAADDRLDVIDGAAGAALALLAYIGTTGRADLLPLAVACGDHLIRRRELLDDASAWPSSSGVRLIGFAHGTAGIAAALCRLFRITGEQRFAEAALLACRFVEAQFVERFGNYPIAAADHGGRSRGAMLAWCHGAPGIILGLCRELDILSKTAILSQFETALRAVARDEPAQVDHLCCGGFGRVDAVLTAARAWRHVELEREAWTLADAIGRRAVARGHFRLSGSGVDYRVFDPGFFRGLSGIAYGWLRLANPSLPSVASFDAVAHQ